MAGQLELRERLKMPRNKALSPGKYSLLSPLTPSEAKGMLEHRCLRSEIPLPFSDEVIDLILGDHRRFPRDILSHLRLCVRDRSDHGREDRLPRTG